MNCPVEIQSVSIYAILMAAPATANNITNDTRKLTMFITQIMHVKDGDGAWNCRCPHNAFAVREPAPCISNVKNSETN